MITSRLWPISRRPPGGYDSKCKGGDNMVLKMYRGEHCITTVYNVLRVNQDDVSHIVVKNVHAHEIIVKKYYWKKDYDRFELVVD